MMKTGTIVVLAVITAIVILAGCTIAKPASATVEAQGCPWGITVRRGETVNTISRMYGVSVKAIEAANPGVRIRPGAYVYVPCPEIAVPKTMLDKNGRPFYPKATPTPSPDDWCWDGWNFYVCR